MNENEKLLGNLINAVQKGLQSGKLDITDMQYLKEHLDLSAHEYLESQSAQLSKVYHKALNEHVAMEKRKFDIELRHTKYELEKAQRAIANLQQTTDKLNSMKKLPMGIAGIASVGALLVLPLIVMALGTMWSGLYSGLRHDISTDWIFYLVFAVLSVICMLIYMFIFGYLYVGFVWIVSKFERPKE